MNDGLTRCDRNYNKMREKNRNNFKLEPSKSSNYNAAFNTSIPRNHIENDTNISAISNDYSIIDYTPVTHADA